MKKLILWFLLCLLTSASWAQTSTVSVPQSYVCGISSSPGVINLRPDGSACFVDLSPAHCAGPRYESSGWTLYNYVGPLSGSCIFYGAWSKSSVTPVCPSGEQWNGSACANNNPCSGLSGQSMVQFGTFAWPRGVTSSCSGGCAQTVNGDALHGFYWSDYETGVMMGHYTSSQFVFTGEQCTGGTDPLTSPQNEVTEDTAAPKCKAGESFGQVNGVDVCVPSSTTSTVTETTSTTKDATGNTTGTSTTTREVECEGDICTVTTTTENPDGTSTVNVSGSSKGEFCASNPGARECKESQFAGSCEAGFSCDGDAIQCAIAADQYKTNCELLAKDSDLQSKLNELIGDGLEGLDLDGSSIQAPTSAGGSSCSITPFSIPVGIGAFTVDLTHMCAYLSIIKAIVTAFGFVMWTLIVFVRQ